MDLHRCPYDGDSADPLRRHKSSLQRQRAFESSLSLRLQEEDDINNQIPNPFYLSHSVEIKGGHSARITNMYLRAKVHHFKDFKNYSGVKGHAFSFPYVLC
ncbi:hypothetical protein Lal_00008089 [Lupinus albus]|nr:hypothetical protein Lal_00008089 [Lupinus albus]